MNRQIFLPKFTFSHVCVAMFDLVGILIELAINELLYVIRFSYVLHYFPTETSKTYKKIKNNLFSCLLLI